MSMAEEEEAAVDPLLLFVVGKEAKQESAKSG